MIATTQPPASPALFSPLTVGLMPLSHRIVMAPLTRARANNARVPSPLAATYYAQRTTPGGLVISEATFISPPAGGYPNVPGIYDPLHLAGWKTVVDAVHKKGGFIYLQLWALGRCAYPAVLTSEPGGPYDVVSSSSVPLSPESPTPRPLTIEEIGMYVNKYAEAARNFVDVCGGDGVEIHYGYLLNQFLCSHTNLRTDAYGGSVANRLRFPLEAVEAVVTAVGADKVGVRISPFSGWQIDKMSPEDLVDTYGTFVRALKDAHPSLAYLSAIEPRVHGVEDTQPEETESLDFLHEIWSPKPFISAGGHTPTTAHSLASEKPNTIIAFGRHFIPNPDLVYRIKHGHELAKYDRDQFYVFGSQDPVGYTAYPRYSDEEGIGGCAFLGVEV